MFAQGKKIVVCGFGRAGRECFLQLLLCPGVQLQNIMVFTHEGASNAEFMELLNALDVSYSTRNINECGSQVAAFKPDYLLSIYYRYIISNQILGLVDFNAMNLHPSLLPDYKGCFSSVWAILNGESRTGITFHKITSDVDAGNILLQKQTDIQETDTAYSLYHKLVSLFVAHFREAFQILCEGRPGIAQDRNAAARYYKREVPFGGVLDAKAVSYEQAQRFVRAMHFPPLAGAKFIVDGRTMEVNTLAELKGLECLFRQPA